MALWFLSTSKAETLNRFAVTAHNGQIVSVVLQRSWSPDEARSLAAWLVVALGLNDASENELEKVAELVRAIEHT